ncbi:MAG: Tn3 family transposase [Gammaproteobacteria bacterium]
MDNRVSAHAARLIANCIIAYKSVILNTTYEKMIRDGVSQDVIDEFARVSPIAWIHILFAGRYSFKKSNDDIDVEAMAQAVEMYLSNTSGRLPSPD